MVLITEVPVDFSVALIAGTTRHFHYFGIQSSADFDGSVGQIQPAGRQFTVTAIDSTLARKMLGIANSALTKIKPTPAEMGAWFTKNPSAISASRWRHFRMFIIWDTIMTN